MKRLMVLFISMMVLVCCSRDTVFNQQNLNYKTKNDYILRSDTSKLEGRLRKDLSVEYRNSVLSSINNSSGQELVPFYPYITINLSSEFLPQPPFRVYLGKLTPGNNDDYLITIVPCKKVILENTEIASYTDILPGQPMPASENRQANWYSVRVSTYTTSTERVIYNEVNMREAQLYVNNFDIVMRRKGLYGKFPLYTVIESRQNSVVAASVNYRVKLQPVIKTRLSKPGNGGSRNMPVFETFRFFGDESYTLQDPENKASLCCEAPPEGGNSLTH